MPSTGQLIGLRLIGAVLFGFVGVGLCNAQSGTLIPVRKESRPITTIDADTRWAFRALSPVTVNSTIVRLGDVAQPLDPNLAAWPRLSRSPIGLMPIDGSPMTVDRDRLSLVLAEAEATPQWIDWIGPTKIHIEYRPAADAKRKSNSMIAQAGEVRPASYVAPSGRHVSASQTRPEPLDASLAKQIIYWIDLALERQQQSTIEAFQIEIDPAQPALRGLQSVRGIEQVRFVGPVKAGLCKLHVVGRSKEGRVESELAAELTANPIVVVAKKSLPRGHRIALRDLTTRPISAEDLDPSFVTDLQELIGLEVRGTVQSDRPIARSKVGAPILVHRGDLVEVRVVGGGISVTTNARALEEGAEADLVQVETLTPRKKLLARVAQPGLVEIITRAPRVSR